MIIPYNHSLVDCCLLLYTTEIPLLLMLFVTVFLSGVGAYVHLYVREVYTFGIFVTLEFFQVAIHLHNSI